MSTAADTVRPPTSTRFEGWQSHVFSEIDSTNTFAGPLPAWSAVRADIQTGGRGRTRGRHWTSDAGGLWLSAVLPCPGPRTDWETLPIAAGWAVLRVLRQAGVADLRLRWPNDIMAGRGKLAGLLVERFRADTAVIGVGLNISNHPESADPRLAGLTTRLDDLVPGCTTEEMTPLLLRAFRHMHDVLSHQGFPLIADELNHDWREPRRVEVTLNGQADPFVAHFQGINSHGHLQITTPHDGLRVYAATQVALLRELP